MLAARVGDMQIVKTLLDKPHVDVNAVDNVRLLVLEVINIRELKCSPQADCFAYDRHSYPSSVPL